MAELRELKEPKEHWLRVPLRVPFRGVSERSVLLLEGPQGWGECSPFPGYPCDPAVARHAAEEAVTKPFPKAVRDRVHVNAVIEAANPAQAVEAARAAVVEGFTTLKIKLPPGREGVGGAVQMFSGHGSKPASQVGSGAIDLCERNLHAVRDAVGSSVKLRLDVNAAWDLATAKVALARLAAVDLEFVEQPVVTLDDLALLRRAVDIPLAADECIRTLDDARKLRSLGAADVMVVKVQAVGGIDAALRLVEAAGVPAVVSSMIETSVGLSVGLALAAALPELPFACGLGTAGLLAQDVVVDSLVPVGGCLDVRRPSPDPDLLALLRAASPERF